MEKASCGEKVGQKGVFGESVASGFSGVEEQTLRGQSRNGLSKNTLVKKCVFTQRPPNFRGYQTMLGTQDVLLGMVKKALRSSQNCSQSSGVSGKSPWAGKNANGTDPEIE